MSHVTYTIVEHDGGWAYKVGDVFSETFPSRQQAHAAAERAAQEQRVPGHSSAIEYEGQLRRWQCRKRTRATTARTRTSRD